jgi:primosomal protein N' (replication factor Y) (superfamily II helicase)
VPRICRVAPDVTAVERVFDYVVPDSLASLIRVGAIVRVPLHGRRVRGWVVADDVQPGTRERLLDVLAVGSDGPPPGVVDLAGWIAWRWAGPRIAVLRSASAPNRAAPTPNDLRPAWPGGPRDSSTTPVRRVAVVRRPPLADRRELVASMCAPEGSTLVAVADGSRARSLAQYLRAAGREVASVHSDESDAARTAAWRRAARGGCVVVGGRSAALAPVPDLAAAIVVDDADEALQEERSPTWHARDVLYERAARAEASWAVVSPAPTVEALGLGPFDLDALPPDVEARGWPRALVVDRREEPPGAGLLTESLAEALRDAGGPAVCVLNRRGRFRVLACEACQALLRWDRTAERPMICDECGATRLRVLRAGVTRVREELAALFPRLHVVDVDAATAEVGDADIVIGTEAALHRPELRRRRPALVAFLDLDQELLAPRYRAAAQAQWLTTRGAQLLAGRPRDETRLVVQTRQPDHEVVRALVRGEPTIVTEAESARRLALGFPPFGALAEISGDDAAVLAAVDALRGLEVAAASVQVIGPTAGRALVVAPAADVLADALGLAHAAGRATGRVRVVVDPPRV